MMDAMEVAAALRRAAENAGCGTHAVVSGGEDCPDGLCSECLERSRAWFSDAADAIERCALPEGVEWPRYESGEPVRFDDCVENRYGTCTVNSVRFYKGGGVTVYGEDGGARFVVVTEPVMHEPIRKARPKVLAADGEPLEQGQTVWDVLGNRRFKVLGFGSDAKLGEFTVKTVGIDGMSLEGYSKPSDLTHQRPVLDADGEMLLRGETVYNAVDGEEYRVRGFVDGEVLQFGHTLTYRYCPWCGARAVDQ